jgi:transcriptional regulator with XRE-family HTH domain
MAYSPEKLGPNVKVAREGLHITQEQAAQRAGVAIRTYVAWEHGDAMPRGYNLDRLAKALKTDVMDLMAGVSDNEELPLSEQLADLRVRVDGVAEKLDAVLALFTSSEALAAAIDLRRGEVESQSRGVVVQPLAREGKEIGSDLPQGTARSAVAKAKRGAQKRAPGRA